MPQTNVNITDIEINKALRVYMVENNFSSKEKAIIDVLKKRFKNE